MKKVIFLVAIIFVAISVFGQNLPNGTMNRLALRLEQAGYNAEDVEAMQIPPLKAKGTFAEVRLDWQKFYKANFGWSVDFSQVTIPQMPAEGNWRLLFIPKGMTLNLAFSACEKLFKSWKWYGDLDKVITKNTRNPDQSYAVWVQSGTEPDEEFLGKSVKQADPDMKIGITLLERILFEAKYFTETGKHLDIKGITYCSGSRTADGHVPRAYLGYGGRFEVCYYGIDYSFSKFGIRRAVAF